MEASKAQDPATASAYDDLPDGLVVADAERRVRVFNRAAERITGLRADHALGRPLELALPLVDLEGRAWWACTEPYDGLAVRTGQPETRLLLPDGRDVLVTARYVRDHAGPVHRVAVKPFTLVSGERSSCATVAMRSAWRRSTRARAEVSRSPITTRPTGPLPART